MTPTHICFTPTTTCRGLPILYHPACIDGQAEHTDSSLLTAYKAQAAERCVVCHTPHFCCMVHCSFAFVVMLHHTSPCISPSTSAASVGVACNRDGSSLDFGPHQQLLFIVNSLFAYSGMQLTVCQCSAEQDLLRIQAVLVSLQ